MANISDKGESSDLPISFGDECKKYNRYGYEIVKCNTSSSEDDVKKPVEKEWEPVNIQDVGSIIPFPVRDVTPTTNNCRSNNGCSIIKYNNPTTENEEPYKVADLWVDLQVANSKIRSLEEEMTKQDFIISTLLMRLEKVENYFK
jgi:hypothetical protein